MLSLVRLAFSCVPGGVELRKLDDAAVSDGFERSDWAYGLGQCSQSVFGVSAESMQCSYDHHGNSVPTILLLMQERLYHQGGLKVLYQCTSSASSDSFLSPVWLLTFIWVLSSTL